MDKELLSRIRVGCLGALTPILINVLIVDLKTQLSDIDVVSAFFYLVRVAALCAAASIVVYLNSDEKRPIKVFQLGIAAPALLTGMLNGAVIANKQNAPAQPSAHAAPVRPVGTYAPAPQATFAFSLDFVGTARAQPVPLPPGVLDCNKAPQPTFNQQVLRGLVGIVPDNQWFVVIGSNPTAESAIGDADVISRRYAGRFEARVCAPAGGADSRYRVVVGEYLTYEQATQRRLQAVAAGLPGDSWVWNPTLSAK